MNPPLQQRVNLYFQDRAPEWKRVYEVDTVASRIYQERHQTALQWIENLQLPPEAPILDVGCGAGLLSVAMAANHQVTALDGAQAMLDLTMEEARRAGVESRLRTVQGDVHALDLADSSYAVVTALGVLPWLHSPELALREILRVLRPGGHLVVTADNAFRLSYILDPARSHFLAWPRMFYSKMRRALRPKPAQDSLQRFDSLFRLRCAVAMTGFDQIAATTVGFGPFTFCDREVLSNKSGLRLHRQLQSLADRQLPLLRAMGSHCMLLAQKPNSTGTKS